MSSEAIIEVTGLGKCYQTYERPHHRLLQMLFSRFGRAYHRDFWALHDVTFTIPKGRIVGVLGKNGAGKSTLLQIICGTLTHSHGQVSVRGRVAALLELGSGFNPEFTGIENVYMNAQLLGMTREQTDAKLEAILAFADIGAFANQPVKTYSSGMFARLAFSVVIHVEPDILIVDEALSVGDAWFQHKSMARMRQLMESGCTVLFVSHAIDAVRALCDEVIWLEKGCIKMQGGVTEVTNAYMNDVFIERNRILLETSPPKPAQPDSASTPAPINITHLTNSPENTASGELITINSIKIINSRNIPTEALLHNEVFDLAINFSAGVELTNLNVGFILTDLFGQQLVGGNLLDKDASIQLLSRHDRCTVKFRTQMTLRGGQSYALSLRFTQGVCKRRTDMVVISSYEQISVIQVLQESEPNWLIFNNPYEATVSVEK